MKPTQSLFVSTRTSFGGHGEMRRVMWISGNNGITFHKEADFPDAGALGEALEALDDAIDIMEDTQDEIE